MPRHPTGQFLTTGIRQCAWPFARSNRLAAGDDADDSEQGKDNHEDPASRQTPPPPASPDKERQLKDVVRSLDRKDQEELLTVLNQILGRD